MANIDNEPNLAHGFSNLINAADDHQSNIANSLTDKQESYSDSISTMTALLRRLKTQRDRFENGEKTISLEDDPETAALIKQLQEQVIPALSEDGIIKEDSAPFREGGSLTVDKNGLADLEDEIHVMRDMTKNARSHLSNDVWQTAHNHAMMTATLTHLDPHRASDAMIEQQKPRI